MGAHADAALAHLRGTLRGLIVHPGLPETVQDRAADASAQGDIVAALRAAALAMFAAEEAEKAAKAARELLDATILGLMEEVGVPALDVAGGKLSVVAGRRGVAILDPSAIPAEFLRPRPPEPNREVILQHLAAGEPVEGCALRNGASHLRFMAARG